MPGLLKLYTDYEINDLVWVKRFKKGREYYEIGKIKGLEITVTEYGFSEIEYVIQFIKSSRNYAAHKLKPCFEEDIFD